MLSVSRSLHFWCTVAECVAPNGFIDTLEATEWQWKQVMIDLGEIAIEVESINRVNNAF